MKKLDRRWLVLVMVLMVAGIIALVQGPSPAVAGPEPDCGPTFQWNCVVPGCPSCPEYYFEGTVCEKNRYEKRTGQVCTPF